jgi:hypothetical protein
VGTLIVSAATLAWTVYVNLRDRAHGQEPEADSIARQVRITLRDQDSALPPSAERIVEVVVTETLRQARQPQE